MAKNVPSMNDSTSVLVIAGFGIWVEESPRVGKITTHIHPIADAADEVFFVCTGPTTDRTDITFVQLEPSRWKLLTLLRQCLMAMWLSLRNDYDLIVSYSLVPYGLFALLCKSLSRTPTHLGIIGGDIDVHAGAWYGVGVRWLFRRFDVVTVAGEEFRRRLETFGVDPIRIYTILHPVDDEYANTGPFENPEYDILWLTRVSSEKDPMLFVRILRELRDRSIDFSAAIVGSGPQLPAVHRAVKRNDLEDRVDIPGWTETPATYYRNSRIYVMTSTREMLPLSLVEAMLVGVPPVVPPLGAIPDVVDDRKNGIVVADREYTTYADAIETLLSDERLRCELAANADAIGSKLSHETVAQQWGEVLRAVQ